MTMFELLHTDFLPELSNYLSKQRGWLIDLLSQCISYPSVSGNEQEVMLFIKDVLGTLQGELSGTENRIQVVRQVYNDNVRQYNERVQSGPSNIIAGMFNFELEEFFEIEEGARERMEEAPRVDFTGTAPAEATPPPDQGA